MSVLSKRAFLVLLLAGGIWSNAWAENIRKTDNPPTLQSVAETVLEYKVPCLTVHNDDQAHGKISYMPLKFTRRDIDKPLRIMITDDTPSGSGQTIHSSIWLAAVTAAMLRNDTMHGVTISVEFTGNIDGPSAGGVTCLAILSAMDGVPLPKDFAMTGTILPDGTIGVVGGVPEKIRAAAQAGVKRIFIPAFLRIIKNSKGEDVDLNRLASSLKVELHRVENITEAYAILHNKPYQPGGYINVRNMTTLSPEIEDVLLPVYRDLYKKVSEKVKANPKLKKCAIFDDYILSPDLAQDYYQEGKLLPATLQIFRSWQAWLAREKSDAFINQFYKEKNPDWSKITYLKEYHLRKLLLALREATEKELKTLREQKEKADAAYAKQHYKGTQDPCGYYPYLEGLAEITAQLEPVDRDALFVANMEMLTAKRANAEQIKTFSREQLNNCWYTELDLLRLYYLATENDSSLNDFLGKLGKAMPQLHSNKRAAEVERLFYSAARAADSVAIQNFQSTLNDLSDQAQQQVAEREFQNNPLLASRWTVQNHALLCHALLQPDSEKKPSIPAYHLQASLKAQVTAFAYSSAVLVMYGADQSNDFIPHLWRNARSAAIQNINDCVKAGIPCLPAICDFETAEASRDNSKNAVSALVSYWRASLYSKALLLSFKQK